MQIDRDTCRDFARSSKLEWLETNGTGAFAMGTVAGVNTRRYHGLLIASLRPPVERNVLLSRVEEEAWIDGRMYAIGVCQYPGAVAPSGYRWLGEFVSDPCATWRFDLNGVALEKQVYMIDGKQAAVIRYRCSEEAEVRVRPFLAYRDYHSLGHKRDDVYGSLPRIAFQHDGVFEENADWYYNVEYLMELDRGLDFREDVFTPGVIVLKLKAGEWSPIVAGVETASYQAPVKRSDPFTVRRADGSPTIIAGYPWFTDWGRDTMISLPGLLITAGRLDEAREIIEGFIAHMRQGVIPNRFPDAGEEPEYNTADATLWMIQAMNALVNASPDRATLRSAFYPAIKEIIEWHIRGTWFGIGVDPTDHLLRAGGPGSQLTWMDAKIGDWVVTPRHGKPVEINALWYSAARIAADWAARLGDKTGYAADYAAGADAVRESFRAKFWNPSRGCLYDALQDQGPIDKIRPNQIFAISVAPDLLDREQQQAIVRIVERELLTPAGLRTVDRNDPEYCGLCTGDPTRRDAAYHRGTVWPWLMGAFVDAYLIAFGRDESTVAHCRGLIDQLEAHARESGCPDSIAEIYDGDAPHAARGCPAQAWSVAEIARAKASIGQP